MMENEIREEAEDADNDDRDDHEDVNDSGPELFEKEEFTKSLRESFFAGIEQRPSTVPSNIEVIPNEKQSEEAKNLIREKQIKIAEAVFEDMKAKIAMDPNRFDSFTMYITVPRFKLLEHQTVDRFASFVERINMTEPDFLSHFNISSNTKEVNQHVLR